MSSRLRACRTFGPCSPLSGTPSMLALATGTQTRWRTGVLDNDFFGGGEGGYAHGQGEGGGVIGWTASPACHSRLHVCWGGYLCDHIC